MTQQLISLAREHQAIVSNAATLAVRETQAALQVASELRSRVGYGLLRETIPEILSTYASVVGTVDEVYYQNLRESAGITSTFRPSTRPVDWQEIASPISGFAIARTVEQAPLAATVTLIGGSVSSQLFNFSRNNVAYNAGRDPSPTSYKRVTRPKACDFCLYMATGFTGDGSNEEYKNFHDSCGCIDVPVFAGQTFVDPPYYDEFKAQTVQANSRIQEIRASARAIDPGMRDVDFFRKYPDAAITTPNIVKQVRNVRLDNPLELPKVSQ
jgi:hypothetical protein